VGDRILVIDDDPDVRSVVEITLQLEGFEVDTAPGGTEGLERLAESEPDAIVLDVMMPVLDGLEVLGQIRADARYSHVPVLILTAKVRVEDRVAGLERGADDYLTKPFEPEELIARVRALVRRSRDTGSISPLTGLPGNVRIQKELARRFDEGEPFAVVYADMNDFKSLNDRYDWIRGDEGIDLLAEVLKDVTRRLGDRRTFLGHVGGDDFVVVTSPERAEPIAKNVASEFDERSDRLYDDDDLARGYVEVEDRQGTLQRYPPVTVSLGVASNDARPFGDYRGLVAAAAEMKQYAKRSRDRGSNYAVDRRTET
jgi:diguanylate cyclase (GGDEF)-like protein